MWGGKCAYCGAPATAIDHAIALTRGGTHWPANLRPSCKSCNSSKGKKKLSVWLAERKSRQILVQAPEQPQELSA